MVQPESSANTPLLAARGLTKAFGAGRRASDQFVALEDFSLQIAADRPTITTIAGESGSGKTTLALLALGLIAPTAGQLLYRGQDVSRMSKRQESAFRQEVQAIFQDPFEVYNPVYRVDRVLKTVVKKFRLAPDRQAADRLMREALATLGLEPDDVLGKFPHQLSGGQRQRIMFARALLPKPRLIVADEPVSMIDASLRALILEHMLRLKHDFGISFLYITHDLSTAYQISDDIYILYRGRVAERGDVARVIEAPRHPYTRLLVDSVPTPDPAIGWETRIELPPEVEARIGPTTGCAFADRCPSVMPQCRRRVPPLIQIGHNHEASCFLYGDGGDESDAGFSHGRERPRRAVHDPRSVGQRA
ncbi:MAG: ABC transporter ATP-binding protein [Thermomicrobiales bacterium]